jgi:hypothetical protein
MMRRQVLAVRSVAVLAAVAWLTVLADTPSAQPVQDGKWKVSTTQANRSVYTNYSGAAQKVLFTVCSTAGGTIEVLVGNGGVATLDPGNCISRTESMAHTLSITLHMSTGTSANGTYSVSVLP